MFKKRSQGEIQEQKPVPAEGVQLGGGGQTVCLEGSRGMESRGSPVRGPWGTEMPPYWLAESDSSVCPGSQRSCAVELWTEIHS